MTVQNVQTQKPVKNTLSKLENVRGISSAISCVAYVEEGDKALLSFTLDRMTTASGEHQAIFALKNDFVSPNYNSMYSSGVLSSITGNDVTFYNCIYDGTTKELTVKLFPELSTGSTKISNQRVLIILTSDAVFNSGDTAMVATSAEVDISREFADSTPIAMDTSTVGASIVPFYGGINPPTVPSLPLHTVTFNTNGGSANPTSRSINPGATLVSLPPPPTRAHHTFRGWFNIQDTTGGTQFHADTPINSNVALWARWETNSPTILTPQDSDEPVEHQNLEVTWSLVPNATYTIEMHNLRDNHITLHPVNLPVGRGQHLIPASALTAGARHRVDVSAVTLNAINGLSQREFTVRGATNFISPYENKVSMSSPFAFRQRIGGSAELHAALDLSAGLGTRIYAISDGVVIANRDGSPGMGGGYGNHVIIRHRHPVWGDFCALYAHLRHRSSLAVGSTINQGTLIGFEGGTQGPGLDIIESHLHFQTWLGTGINYNPHNAFNPLDLYDIAMTRTGIDNSTLFTFASGSGAYSWNWHFLSNHPTGSSALSHGTALNNPTRMNELITFLRSIDNDRVNRYLP